MDCAEDDDDCTRRPPSTTEEDDNDEEVDDSNIVRRSFMPGILSTVPRGVRQAFKPLVVATNRSTRNKNGRTRKTLGPSAPKQMCVSKFLTGQSFEIAKPLLVVSSGSEEDEEEEAEEQQQPEFLPHERLVLYEPSEEERALGAECIEVPPILCQFLRPHQREGVQFVFECLYGLRDYDGCGAILADDMGLGKTLQSLTVLYTMLKSKDAKRAGSDLGSSATNKDKLIAKRAVVVCPCSLVKNWEAEFEKWINSRATTQSQRVECMALAESSKKTAEAMLDQFLSPACRYDVLVISYETFRAQASRFIKKDKGILASSRKTNLHGCVDVVVCDEAHRLKNADAQTSTALASLACQRRVLLSGTPMQNDLVEFFAMVNFTNPGIFGSKEAFVKQYERPILRGREPDATDKHKAKAAERQKQLSTIADKFIIRRMNRLNAKHLPPKLTQVVCCTLTNTQRRMYEFLVKEREREHASEGSVRDALGYVQLLQKICNHPSLVVGGKSERERSLAAFMPGFDPPPSLPAIEDDENARRGRGGRLLSRRPQESSRAATNVDPGISGKMRVLKALMKTLYEERKERIVIVSVFMTTLDLIETVCETEGWPCCKLGGSTPAKRRKKFNDEFNDPSSGYFAFLLSSKAGGCGLNLIGGSRLVMFDLDWNPATDKQAAARCWRDGQKHQCYTYRFVSTGTLEERMLQRQLSKEGLQNVIEDKEQVNHFATDDLKRLFEYQADTVSDLHDELQCQECKGKHAARKQATLANNGISETTADICADWLKSDVLGGLLPENSALRMFPAEDAVTNKHKLPKIPRKIDIAHVVARLETREEGGNGYAKVADITKDLSLIVKNAFKLWDKSDATYIEAQILEQYLQAHWKPIANRLLETESVAREASASAAQRQEEENGSHDDDDVHASTCHGHVLTARGEEPFKKQLYPLPKEEDLNNWSHHASVDTIDDPVFKRAMRNLSGAVSFVFGMYQDWDLIQLDTELEKNAAKAELVEKADENTNELSPSKGRDDCDVSSKRARMDEKKAVLADATNVATIC